MNWRKLFPLIFLFSLVDGFISNWLYPARLPFLLRDFLILIVYILFFITQESRKWVFEFKRSVGSGVWYLAMLLILLGGVQIFNPGISRIEVGILGFKVMFFYWPLALLAYAYVNSLDCLRSLLKTIVYFSIPICIFGVYQFWQDPDFMVRVFGQGFKRAIVVAFGGEIGSEAFIRVFGTFASSGQFTHFLVINIMFIFGLLFTARSKMEKLMMNGCLALNYLTILATGSRGGLLLLFPTIFLFVILCRWLWRTFFIIFLLSISLNFGFNYLGKAVISRFQTLRDIEMLRDRTIQTTAGMFKMYLEEYPFGRGLGTGSVASRHLLEEGASDIDLIENYPTKLQCEVGIVGVILFYLLLLSLVIHWVRHWLKFIDQRTYVLIAALSSYCWTVFGIVSLFGVIDSSPIAIFLWAEVGMVAKLATFPSDDKYPLST